MVSYVDRGRTCKKKKWDRCVSSSFSLQGQIYVANDVNLMAMA